MYPKHLSHLQRYRDLVDDLSNLLAKVERNEISEWFFVQRACAAAVQSRCHRGMSGEPSVFQFRVLLKEFPGKPGSS